MVEVMDPMVNEEDSMIIKIRRSGKDIVIPAIVHGEGNMLSLEISQNTMLNVHNRFKVSDSAYDENGLEFADRAIHEGRTDVLWELVLLLNPIVIGGLVGTPQDFKHLDKQLSESISEAMNLYVEEVYRIDWL